VVSEYDREASLKRPRPTRGSCNMQKKNEISRIRRSEDEQMNGIHLLI
jgi:hypothetical protein